MSLVPAANAAFFTASSAAAGALIGLLFVAISLRTDAVFGPDAPTSGRALASSAFTALVVAFFISIMASIPHIRLGIVVIVIAALALYNTVKLHRQLAATEAHIALFTFSLIAYSAQVAGGIWLTARPYQASLYDALDYAIISSYATALSRAWVLLKGSFITSPRHASATSQVSESD